MFVINPNMIIIVVLVVVVVIIVIIAIISILIIRSSSKYGCGCSIIMFIVKIIISICINCAVFDLCQVFV